MTAYDAYITTPNDDTLRKVQSTVGERSRVSSPMLPPPRGFSDLDIFIAVHKMADADPKRGRQVDWGSYALLMKRADIEKFMMEFYGPPGAYENEYAGVMQHLAVKMEKVREFIANMREDDWYELVVQEF